MCDKPAMGKIIPALAHHSKGKWNKMMRQNTVFRQTYDSAIAFGFKPAEQSALLNAIKTNPTKYSLDKEMILLPPIEDEPNFLAAMSVYWDFSSTNPDKKNKIVLNLIHREGHILSLRFDQGSQDSDHFFFHVQLNDLSSQPSNGRPPLAMPCNRPLIPLHDTGRKYSIFSLFGLMYGGIYGFRNMEWVMDITGLSPTLLKEFEEYMVKD